MYEPDATDHRLIAALRRDARLPVATLAADLGLSRATVKARLDRLVDTGVIERFTVALNPAHEQDRVRAVTMIELKGDMSRQVIRALRSMPHVARLHSTNGAWDLVAELDCANLRDFDRALREIRAAPGVANSESCLLLDTLGG